MWHSLRPVVECEQKDKAMRFIKVATLIAIFVTMAIGCATNVNNRMNVQNHRDDIDSLLKKLLPVKTEEGGTVVIEGPSIETQRDVHDSLLRIANQTPESRSEVIEALLQILEDPQSREGNPIAYRWTTAVEALGELRATEAIDILIKNLDQTGQNDEVISKNYRPVAQSIATIGEPAIPQLIGALSHSNEVIRFEAASTLASIGRPASGKVQEALHKGNARTRGMAAWALAWIGGEDARTAIKRAIAREKDREALKELKDALREMRRVWGGTGTRRRR